MALTQLIEDSSKDSMVTLSASGEVETPGGERKSIRAEESIDNEENIGSFLDIGLSLGQQVSDQALNSNSIYPTSASLDKSQDAHDAQKENAIGIYHALAKTTLAGSSSESGRLQYSETLTVKVTQKQRVIVRKGDSLAKIIIATYGRFDPHLLDAVLQLNPHISEPNFLIVGQTIELPVVKAQRLY